MRPPLTATAARQGGLITRRQAVEADYSERELRTLTAVNGAWVVVRRGVYVERQVWDAVDPFVGQMALRDRTAHLAMTQPHVLSHDSAARAHALPLLRPPHSLVHITRAGVGGSRTEHGVKHHLAKRTPTIEVAQELPVTGVARTVVDLGREHGLPQGLVACDRALHLGTPALDLHAELAVQRSWPGTTKARAAVRLADGGAESPGESLARLLILELGIGEPHTQFPVRVGRTVFWTDIRVGCHLFEFDGRIKFTRPEQGGVAERPPGDVAWDERKRQQLICSEGVGMSRLIWDDFWGAARARAKARLRAEYDVTLARFGDVLPEHLARTAAELAGQRHARRA